MWNIGEYHDYPANGLIKPDVMAPGELNLCAAPTNGCLSLQTSGQPGHPDEVIYGATGATSGAAAAVAGAALLMLCKDNELTPAEIDSLLETTASSYSPSSKDDLTGSGTIDALSAINATEFFNHFDRMINGTEESDERDVEQTHWMPHLEAGTPTGQWEFENESLDPNSIDGVLEGEAPLSRRSITTVHHDRESYRMDFEFEIKSFPTGGGHSTPIFGAMLRYDPATKKSLYVQSWKQPNEQTEIVVKREQAGDPQGGIVIETATLTWDWAIGTPYAWHIWDDGSTVSLTVDRPGVSGTAILNHVEYACSVPRQRKGLFVQDGTRVQFDNVRIEGFQPVSTSFPSLVISRYMMVGPGIQSIGGCPANNDPVKHQAGISGQGHAGDYWIQSDIRDTMGRPISGYWDVKVDFGLCGGPGYPHPGIPSSEQVYADGPTDSSGRTVFRKVLAFGGKDPCGLSFVAGGQVIKTFAGHVTGGVGGLRNIDLNGDGLVAIQDLSQFQTAFTSGSGGEPKYACDLNLDGVCAINDLGILQLHFTEHQGGGGGDRPSTNKKELDQKLMDRGLAAKEVVGSETGARGEDGELYLTIMDRLPPGAPMPPVNPDNAVTSVGSVGPRGRDITVGLYAAGAELAGAHVRFRWPEGWELVAAPDSLISGQIFGSSDRYWVADRSYVTAFDCVSADPIAIGRFDLHITQGGTLRFDEQNPLVQTLDCGRQIRNLLGAGQRGIEASKGAVEATPMQPAVQLSRSSPTVSAKGAEFTLILNKEVSVSATVYDVAGRVVRVLADQMALPVGTHKLRWDGSTSRGGRSGSGMYIIRVNAGEERLTDHVVLVR